MTKRRINVLVVDDSAVARMHLVQILESDPEISVISAVKDGRAALDFLQGVKPDVVLMDIHMPGLDGFETTRSIMETKPVPIVICTGTIGSRDVATTFRVLEAGAVACVEKPAGRDHPDFDRRAAEIREKVKLMSEVRVVRRWARSAASLAPPVPVAQSRPTNGRVNVIGIGTSTGGPPVLQTILCGLPKGFPIPILIVQHIAAGFLPGLAEWLGQTSGFRIHIAAHGIVPLPGHVYLAPDSFHLGLSAGGGIQLSKAEPEGGLRPSVAFLFRSLAENWGSAAAGVLLTGMGRDGAAELKLMRDQGSVTIAQDRESSVVHGMPGAAIAMGGATHILPAHNIASQLVSLAVGRNGREGGEA